MIAVGTLCRGLIEKLDGEFRTWRGCMKDERNHYFTNMVHGSKDGRMFLEHKYHEYIEIFSLRQLREKLWELCGVPERAMLTVSPCYPERVKEMYSPEEADEYLVIVDGDWDTSTSVRFYPITDYDVLMFSCKKQKTVDDFILLEKEAFSKYCDDVVARSRQ